MMSWWLICFLATSLTVFGKWYFSNNISRMRQILSRQQREALELKGALQDARTTHSTVLRQIKNHELDIARSTKRITELKSELNNRRKPQADAKKRK